MMPVEFEGYNMVLTKPDGWTDEQCGDLHIYAMREPGKIPTLTSKWMPNKEDIEAINAGRGIYVIISGVTMPPISLATVDENNQPNE